LVTPEDCSTPTRAITETAAITSADTTNAKALLSMYQRLRSITSDVQYLCEQAKGTIKEYVTEYLPYK